MSDIDPVAKKALSHFHAGHNCAQSVLLAMAEHWSVNSELIPKIAAPFGGGIGRCGSVLRSFDRSRDGFGRRIWNK